jgi:hypothetical protein
MPWVRSTFTRRIGLTAVNLLVKCAEISSPHDAFSAIESAANLVLDVLGIASLYLFSGLPGGDQMIRFASDVLPDLEKHRR